MEPKKSVNSEFAAESVDYEAVFGALPVFTQEMLKRYGPGQTCPACRAFFRSHHQRDALCGSRGRIVADRVKALEAIVNEIYMRPVLAKFPFQLTSVRNYAQRVLRTHVAAV